MDASNGWQPKHGNEGKVIFGTILAAAGVLLLLHTFHILPVYSFHLGWPVVVIVIGVILGIKNNFRKNAWWILILIGLQGLLPDFYIGDVPSHRIFWPLLLIALGLAVIFRRRDPQSAFRRHRRWEDKCAVPLLNNDSDTVNIDVTFSGRKEIVTSKAFRGGVIRANFSGVELNLASADGGADGLPMILEVHTSFAGVELIVPSHWEVQNEIRPMMGSVEDDRTIRTPDAGAVRRLLVLRGSCNFGSVELKSY